MDISNKSYMSWVFDVEIHFDVKNPINTIKYKTPAPKQDCIKANDIHLLISTRV